MSRTKTKRTLATTVSMLLGTGILALSVTAHADKPTTTPGADNKPKAEAKAEAKPAAKADEAKTTATTVKADDKADKKDPPGLAKKGDPAADRAERKAKQREAQREQLKSSLKGPMTEAMRQEIRRHAQRVARIERIKSLATEAKDKDVAERADKLLAKENARHDKWMSNAIAASTNTNKPVDTNANAKAEVKGGAK